MIAPGLCVVGDVASQGTVADGSPGAQASPEVVASYLERLRSLVEAAASQGVVLTIDVRPRVPLMMGWRELVPSARAAWRNQPARV